MGGCVSQTPKPDSKKNQNAPIPQTQAKGAAIALANESYAQVEARHKKLADAYAKSCENQKQLDERILSTADTLVRMPEYLERLMSGKLEENVDVVKSKVAEVDAAQVVEKAAEMKSTAAEAINDMKNQKMDDKSGKIDSTVEKAKQGDQNAAAAPAESDVKKDEPAGVPEETKQSAINDEFSKPEVVKEEAKAADNKAAQPAAAVTADPKKESQVKEDQIKTESKPAEQQVVQQSAVAEESEYDKNLRVLRAGCAHKKQVEAFTKALHEETKACEAYIKGRKEEDKKKPLNVGDKFKNADKLLASYDSNSVAKFEGIYKNRDLKRLVNDLCCCYFEKPIDAALDSLIKSATQDSDKLLEERYTIYLEMDAVAQAPSGLEQFASKNQDHFDEIKKSWAEGTSPMKDSIANHTAELAKVNAEWKEEQEQSPVREQVDDIFDKMDDAVHSMMVKLKDIELPSNPRGDDEVFPEESSDDEDEPADTVLHFEKKPPAAALASNVSNAISQKQAVVIDAEEASRQANAADQAAIAQ